jgi:hypothetical protein
MEWHDVKSSNLKKVGYDQERSVLGVVFKSGAEYHYEGVTEGQFQELLTAESVGKHFNTTIKTAFEGKLQ